jgi:broad specificity phosphatase PhoE
MMSGDTSRIKSLLLNAAASVVGGLVGGGVAYLLLTRALRERLDEAARIPLPKRIILVRHGESEGNINRDLFKEVPDYKHGLTAQGRAQAAETGAKIASIVAGGPATFFYSPYERTRQTQQEIQRALEAAGCPIGKLREDSRLREQEFGSFRLSDEEIARIEKHRKLYGRFWYRVPNGESGADVLDRISSFFHTLFRSFGRDAGAAPDNTVIIVTHGLTLRLFLTRFFHWSVECFEATRNPGNAEFVMMDRVDGRKGRSEGSCYRLTDQSLSLLGVSAQHCKDTGEGSGVCRAVLGSP